MHPVPWWLTSVVDVVWMSHGRPGSVVVYPCRAGGLWGPTVTRTSCGRRMDVRVCVVCPVVVTRDQT